MTVDPEDMDLFVDSAYLREADLAAHLTHARAHDGQKPAHVVRYYLPAETRERLREARPEDLEENEREDEFLTKFARELLVQARALRPARAAARRRAGRVERCATRRWRAPRPSCKQARRRLDARATDQGASEIAVTVTHRPQGQHRRRGRAVRPQGHGREQGQGAALPAARDDQERQPAVQRARAGVRQARCPARSKTWTHHARLLQDRRRRRKKRECTLPETLRERADGIRIAVRGGPRPRAARRPRCAPQVQAMEPPQFAYTVHVADDGRGNGDGAVQLGELATVYMRIRNVGKGVSKQTVAQPAQPERRRASCCTRVASSSRSSSPARRRWSPSSSRCCRTFDQPEAKLEASVVDETAARRRGREARPSPIAATARTPVRPRHERPVVARAGAQVLERPEPGAKVIAQVEGGALSRCRCRRRSASTAASTWARAGPAGSSERDLRGGSGKGGKLDRRARAHAAAARGRLRQHARHARARAQACRAGPRTTASCATSTSSSARTRSSTSRTATAQTPNKVSFRHHGRAAAGHQLRHRGRARGQRDHVAQDVHRAPRRARRRAARDAEGDRARLLRA